MLTRTRTLTAAAVVALAAASGAPAVAGALTSAPDGRMVMLYDTAASVRTVALGQDGLDQASFGLHQQAPSTRVLAAGRQVWKVAGTRASAATPGLAGRSAESIATLLRDRIRRSGAKMVAIDEIGGAFNGADGGRLAAALDILSRQSLPEVAGGAPLNTRVHVYVQGVAGPIVNPAAWEHSWAAISRAGGVWWQTYTTGRTWDEAEWALWSRLIQEQMVAHGGDPSRLRWVLRHHASTTIATQLEDARRGAACGPLANGLGGYRLAGEAAAFRDGYRQIATGQAQCQAAPQAGPTAAVGWLQTAQMESGVRLVPGQLRASAHGASRMAAGSLPRGRPARLILDLGADPLGIAARLGADQTSFWATAGAQVRVTGAGIDQRWPLVAGVPLDVYVLPRSRGDLRVTVTLPVAAVRGAMGGAGVDLLGTLDTVGGAPTAALARRIAQAPGRAVISIPLRSTSGATAPLRVDTAPGATPARLRLLRPARLSGDRVAPRRVRPLAVRVTDARGAPVPRVRVSVRLPGGRVRTVVTRTDGTARLAVPRLRGAHLAYISGTRLRSGFRG